MRISFRAKALVLLVSLAAAAAPARPGPAPDTRQGDLSSLLQADSLIEAGRLAEADQLLAPAIRQARRRGDRRSLLALRSLQATLLSRGQRGRAAESAARDVLWLGLGLRDTAAMMHGLTLLGTRPVEHDALVEPAHEWLLRLALERGDRQGEGYARMGLADEALEAGLGAEARRGYERALDLLRSVGDWRGQALCLTRFGEASFVLGDFDRGRRLLVAAERLATRGGDRWAEGDANVLLGSLELWVGDADVAVERYRRALDALGGVQEAGDWMALALDLAEAEIIAGRLAQARTTLDYVLAACDSLGAHDLRGRALVQSVRVLDLQGRPAEVAGLCRRSLVPARRLGPGARVALLLALAGALAAQDSASQALLVIERQALPLAGRLDAQARLEAELRRAALLRELARPHEALRALGRAARLERAEPTWRLERLLETARCHLALGRDDGAQEALRSALETWERSEPPRDPLLREQRGARARAAALELAGLARRLAADADPDSGDRAAFEVLQRFKARALMESALGPIPTAEAAVAAPPPAALDDLQMRALRPRDLLLDVHVGPDTSFLVAVTRRGLRIVTLPGAEALASSLAGFRQALSGEGMAALDPYRWKATLEPAARLLLDPVADLIQPSRRVLFSGDGPLLRLPLASLSFPPSEPRASLGQEREVLVLPSASFAGRPEPPESAEARRLLALAAALGAGRPGSTAASRAARALGSRFQGGAVLLTGEPGAAPLDLDRLSGFDVLHLATEVRGDDRRPWRTGFRLEDPDSTQGDPYLRATRVAGARLSMALAVFCRYERAAASDPTGEGAQRLAAAFLMAGLPAVVTSLWPVEEETSVRFESALYGALEDGASLAQALRSAQSALRGHRPTRHPIHWAGFVVIGDGGDARIALERRFDFGLPLAFFAVAAVAAVLLALRPRSHQPA